MRLIRLGLEAIDDAQVRLVSEQESLCMRNADPVEQYIY